MVQVFSCKFCKIFKNTFFLEHLRWLLMIATQIYEVIWLRYFVTDNYHFITQSSGHAGGRSSCLEFVNWFFRFNEGITYWSRFFRFFFPSFFLLCIIAIMVVAAAISSKLLFLNVEKNFIKKEPVYILFDINYFKLILSCKHQVWYIIFDSENMPN